MVRRYGRRKRWHFNASANLPFVGKTRVAFGSGKARAQKRAMYKIARTVVRKTTTPKQFINTKLGLAPTAHTMYTYNVLDQITKGTDDENRIGEHIHLKNFLLNIQTTSSQIDQAVDNGVEKYMRIIALTDNAQYTGSGYPGTGFGYSDLFQHNDKTLNMVSPILKENVTVLKDRVYKICDGNLSKTIQSKHIKFNVPLNRNFVYQDGSTYGKTWNLYIVVIVDVPTVTPATYINSVYSWGSHLNFSDTQ